MIRLVYASRSRIAFGESGAALQAILLKSQVNNLANRLSGFLIADGRYFYQILEGDLENVKATYARINADQRHSDVRILDERSIVCRSFSQWSMGGWLLSPETLPLFMKHGINGSSVDTVTEKAVVALALELQSRPRLALAG